MQKEGQQITLQEANMIILKSVESIEQAFEDDPCLVSIAGAVELVKMNHTLMIWLMAIGWAKYVRCHEDAPILQPFWDQMERLKIVFTETQRRDVLQDFLDD